MALNKRLLRKVRNRIAEIPESYDQNHFYRQEEKSPCGSAECLAGETIISAAPTVKQGIITLRRLNGRMWYSISDSPVTRRAAKLLGLTVDEAEKMFGGTAEEWPSPFRAQFQRAKRPRTKARIAVAYLDECLKRGKVTW